MYSQTIQLLKPKMSSENKAEFTYLAEKSQRDLDFVKNALKTVNNNPKTEAVFIDREEVLRAKLDITTKQAKPLIGEPSGDVKSKDLRRHCRASW